MFDVIDRCRICQNTKLLSVLDLGAMHLTGVFPRSRDQVLPKGPVELVKCDETTNGCGLVQLRQTYNLANMYGANYGYRSGLNRSMVVHLKKVVEEIINFVETTPEDIVVDIGSNDATLLRLYPEAYRNLLGIDPSGDKFRSFYPNRISLIADFFSASAFRSRFGTRKAKIVTSFSMFYDLPSPVDFAQQVTDILDANGIWVLEQSYLPSMIATNSFDTICQEHLEYYCLNQIDWICQRVGLQILKVGFNEANGGSFRIYVCKQGAIFKAERKSIVGILRKEKDDGFGEIGIFDGFRRRVSEAKTLLLQFLKTAKQEEKLVVGYGASTKGNVLLQHFSIKSDLLPFIAEVNSDKFGAFTPTGIPIISEEEANMKKPNYKLYLPWHFKDYFCQKEEAFVKQGGKLVFPLPKFHIVESGHAP